MGNIVMIDEQNIEKFRGLYAGDIIANYHHNSICYGYLDRDEEGRMVPTALIMSDFNKTTLVITWMYVAPDYRDRNIMLFLMSKFIENARRTRVIKSIYCVSTNEEVPQFLSTQFGFYFDGMHSGKIMSAKLEALKDLSNKCKSHNPAVFLRDVNKDTLTRLNKYFVANKDIAVGVSLPIKVEDYLDCSMAVVEDNDIKALLLMSEEGESLAVSYAFAKEGQEFTIMYLIVAIEKELAKYPLDKRIIAATINENSENLFVKLFSEYDVEPLYECELFI